MFQANRDGRASTIKTLEGYFERLAGILEVSPVAGALISDLTRMLNQQPRHLNRIISI